MWNLKKVITKFGWTIPGPALDLDGHGWLYVLEAFSLQRGLHEIVI